MTYTVFMFVTRKPGMTLEAFVDHYENKHIPLILEVLGDQAPVRHTRHYVKRKPVAAMSLHLSFSLVMQRPSITTALPRSS
ncbi:hypothetical protein M3J09_003034 [Ascochyta lentis]